MRERKQHSEHQPAHASPPIAAHERNPLAPAFAKRHHHCFNQSEAIQLQELKRFKCRQTIANSQRIARPIASSSATARVDCAFAAPKLAIA